MEYKLTKNDNATADLSFTFTPDEIEQGFQKAYQNAQKKMNIKGFRKGKAPLKMVEKILGESVAEDAINSVITDSLRDVLGKLEREELPYSTPSIKVDKYERTSGLEATASFEVAPNISLGEHKGLKLQTHKVIVSDEEVDNEIDQIQFSLAKLQLKEEGAVSEADDMLEVSLKTLDVEASDEEKERQKLAPPQRIKYYLGRKDNPQGLDENFLNLKVDENKTFSYTYSDEFNNKSLRGQTIEFEITVHSINQVMYPAIDDELAIEWDGTETLEQLRDQLREKLQNSYQSELESMYQSDLLNRVASNSQFTIPETLKKVEAERVFSEYLARNNMPPIPFKDYVEHTKDQDNNKLDTFLTIADNRIKNSLVMMAIARDNHLQVTDEEIQQEVDNYKEHMEKEHAHGPDHEHQHEEPNREIIKENLTIKKVLNYLVEHADKTKINEISVEETRKLLSPQSGENE